MTKTIEEAVQSIAKDFIAEHKSHINNDAPLTHECVQYAVERIFAIPLSSRLTAEEKERVREEYSDNKCLIESASLSYVQREVFQKINETLESIFGADFFKEGE